MSMSKYCTTCNKAAFENCDHEGHNIIRQEDLYEFATKQEELMKIEDVLKFAYDDMSTLKKMIKIKKTQLNKDIKALDTLNREIENEEEKNQRFKENLTEKNYEDLAKYDVNKVAIEVVKFKSEIQKITNDMNVKNMAEALTLQIFIDNQRLLIDKLKKQNEDTKNKLQEILNQIGEKLNTVPDNKKGNATEKKDIEGEIRRKIKAKLNSMKEELFGKGVNEEDNEGSHHSKTSEDTKKKKKKESAMEDKDSAKKSCFWCEELTSKKCISCEESICRDHRSSCDKCKGKVCKNCAKDHKKTHNEE